MNVEKTMEFILQQQAKSEGQLAAIRKLLHTGMQILVKHGEQINQLTAAQTELAVAQKELAAAQKDLSAAQKDLAKSQTVTESKLQSLIDSLRRGGNGRHSKN